MNLEIEKVNKRILWLMGFFGFVCSLVFAIVASVRTGAGILTGTVLAFASYFWLRRILQRAFDLPALENGRPSLAAAGYFSRYAGIGAILGGIYLFGIFPLWSVLLGMAMFAFALTFEGILQIFASLMPGSSYRNNEQDVF
ncbi:MAG TPA: ATP synthase subunit I [Pyrinomonadaceae bacterium]|nr:ATP synthase subunit I [Pyrinomonadaceae bacterium]